MENIKVTPLKTINGVKFGAKREAVREKFGSYEEFKFDPKITRTADDFGYCKVYYNVKNEFEGVEFYPDAEIYVGKVKLFPTSKREAEKALGGEMVQKNGKLIGKGCIIQLGNSKMTHIYFATEDRLNKGIKFTKRSPKKEEKKEEVKTEGADDDSLTSFYDKIKTKYSDPTEDSNLMDVHGDNPSVPSRGEEMFHQKARGEAEKLKHACHKRILLDIYCNILPLDDDYIAGNQGQMKSDIDSMLANKGMSATQYLQSSYEKTKAPLLEFVLRAGNLIGREFLEAEEEKLKDAKEKDIRIAEPEADTSDTAVDDSLVDVQKDEEYETFIDKLKEKTINKIVSDVSKIISTKKEEDNMKFDPNPQQSLNDEMLAQESTTSIGVNYLTRGFLKENVEITEQTQDEMIGLAIRESTLNMMDQIFKQPGSDLKTFNEKMYYGKGILINESALQSFMETEKRYESLYKKDGEKEYDVANFETIDRDGNRKPMKDDEAKKVLDKSDYEDFKNKDKKPS